MWNKHVANNGFRMAYGLIVLMTFLLASPSYSAIYKYKDENGKTHFTDNLSKIPPQYRKNGRLKTMKGAPAEKSKAVQRMIPRKKPSTHFIKAHMIPGGHYVVDVMINGSIPASLIVDTGATMVVLSDKLGKRLGVHRDSQAPTMTYNTAGGRVEAPLFILDSLKIGNAKVVDLEASTNPHFEGMDGLLGMNFLGEFKMEMDRENSQLILKPLGKAKDELWADRNGKWWKSKFDDYTGKLQQLDYRAHRDRKDYVKARRVKKMINHYTKLHSKLDARADKANLPKKYRSYPET